MRNNGNMARLMFNVSFFITFTPKTRDLKKKKKTRKSQPRISVWMRKTDLLENTDVSLLCGSNSVSVVYSRSIYSRVCSTWKPNMKTVSKSFKIILIRSAFAWRPRCRKAIYSVTRPNVSCIIFIISRLPCHNICKPRLGVNKPPAGKHQGEVKVRRDPAACFQLSERQDSLMTCCIPS